MNGYVIFQPPSLIRSLALKRTVLFMTTLD